MKTRKNNDGTVTIRMTFRELGALHMGLYERIQRNSKYALEAEDECIEELYNEFAEKYRKQFHEVGELFDWSLEHKRNK